MATPAQIVTLFKGVPDTITVNGVVYQVMADAQGQKLRDATGQYLYAKKVS